MSSFKLKLKSLAVSMQYWIHKEPTVSIGSLIFIL